MPAMSLTCAPTFNPTTISIRAAPATTPASSSPSPFFARLPGREPLSGLPPFCACLLATPQGTAMTDFRTEKDSLGELPVPAEALYGVQTQRAVINFRISG